MSTYYDWHLIRALAFLAVLGVFILYAFLTGILQRRKAMRSRGPDKAGSAEAPRHDPANDGVVVQPVRHQARNAAEDARQAA